SEGQRLAATLESGQALLQRVAGRVAGAAVLVAEPRRPDRILRVRGGLEYRRHHRAGGHLGLLSGVNGEGIEAVGHAVEATGRYLWTRVGLPVLRHRGR